MLREKKNGYVVRHFSMTSDCEIVTFGCIYFCYVSKLGSKIHMLFLYCVSLRILKKYGLSPQIFRLLQLHARICPAPPPLTPCRVSKINVFFWQQLCYPSVFRVRARGCQCFFRGRVLCLRDGCANASFLVRGLIFLLVSTNIFREMFGLNQAIVAFSLFGLRGAYILIF